MDLDLDLDLAQRARTVLDTERYLVLGTVDPDGLPRVSPVFFTHDRYRDLYWVSRPDTHHSTNLASWPWVSGVVYDSGAPVGKGRAVYVTGRASEVPGEELARACDAAFAEVGSGAHAFTAQELSGPESLRLYRLRVACHEVHVSAGDPTYGSGADRRVGVDPCC
jgi:nitroimidazol reductase NimA-like FMN-containing flavoprotein (pyridoxamine 5'-phosphate oxidase superfamily)